MTFEEWWKLGKPAEVDEFKDYFVECYYEGVRDLFPAAHRLALELECLLMDTKDMAVVSKWWDSAHEALEQWREVCREARRP